MEFITKINDMKQYSRKARKEDKTIGFVPTMGALHDGHMSLVKAAREECDVVVMSIFVNPAQFGPKEDFDKYPRDIEKDKKVAEEGGVDCIFAPIVEDMYPDGYATYIEPDGQIVRVLCGKSRPGHFRGVDTVVAKLFNIVSPGKSYFGQKDAQQAVIIKQMVKDLNMDTEVRVMPIVRESDGLAVSSRNNYLSEEERHQALGLYHSLKQAEQFVSDGECFASRLKQEMEKVLLEGKDVWVDYIEIVDARTLEPVDVLKDETLIAIAAFVGNTRLIDNTIISLKSEA
ncbi:MAG: pantoate--beta-alanine ligase [Candidatus Omnitrophota bacterium]